MGERLVIYGANGHSGRLIARCASALGLDPVLCGRRAAKLESVARELGLEVRVAALEEPVALAETFSDAAVVVNAAGPFLDTAEPVAAACLRGGTHYLDITPENPVVERLARLDDEAKRAGVMIMPAVGFDVVPTDCLALHVARRLGRVRSLAVAVTPLTYLTRGSAKTMLRHAEAGCVRRDGRIIEIPMGSMERSFDFAHRRAAALNINLADAATAYYTTGAPEIETYVEATPLMRTVLLASRAFAPLSRLAPLQVTLSSLAELLPEDPSTVAERNGSHRMSIVVEAHDFHGNFAAARMQTPEAYAFTGVTTAAVAERVLAGDFEPGFQTPARVYGSDFVLGFGDVEREDLA